MHKIAYYNEIDPHAVSWLRELISDGLIAEGDVDERSIVDVTFSDIKGYSQCHWFAGIGGWSLALRLAGWPDDKSVWTASLPCQPFSLAGKGLGKQDERHLLPHFISLVTQCRPTVLFGEQVSAAIKHGWLDDLYAEMEANNYAVGSIVIGAHSVDAAHIRQRLYWVANNTSERCAETRSDSLRPEEWITRSGNRILHDSKGERRPILNTKNFRSTDGEVNSSRSVNEQSPVVQTTGISGMANSEHEQYERCVSGCAEESGKNCKRAASEFTGPSEIEWVYCRDDKYRPVESGIKPLVDGVPRGMVHSSDPRNTQEARAMRLKGYGNAIVPILAAEFIKACIEK